MPEPTEKDQKEEQKPEETPQEPEVSEEEARLEEEEQAEQEQHMADILDDAPSEEPTGDDQPSEEPAEEGTPAEAEETPKEPEVSETKPEGDEKPEEPGEGKEKDDEVFYTVHFPEGVERKTPEQLINTAQQHRILARRHTKLKPLLDTVKKLESMDDPRAEALKSPENLNNLLILGIEAAAAGWTPGAPAQPQGEQPTGDFNLFNEAEDEAAIKREMPETYKNIQGFVQSYQNLAARVQALEAQGPGTAQGDELDSETMKLVAEMDEAANAFFKSHEKYFNTEDKIKSFTAYVKENFSERRPQNPAELEKTLRMALMGYDDEYFASWYGSAITNTLKTEDPKRAFAEGGGSRGTSSPQPSEQQQHMQDVLS